MRSPNTVISEVEMTLRYNESDRSRTILPVPECKRMVPDALSLYRNFRWLMPRIRARALPALVLAPID